MLKFILRRLFALLIVSIAIIYFSFLAIYRIQASGVAPNTPWGTAAAKAGSETLVFFQNALQGDLGTVPTVSGERAVLEIAWEAYKNSMGLLIIALAAAAVVGLAAGHLAVLIRQSGWQHGILFLTLIGISVPSFALAVFLQQAGIRYTLTFGSRLVSMGGYGWDFQHMVMPLIVLAARPVAYIARSTFVSLSQIMEERYIWTAFAKGLSLSGTVFFHALRNLAVPALTAIGISFRFTVSTLPLVEWIFAWPGLGLRILEGINERIPLQVAVLALLLGLTIQLSIFLLDFSYRLIDPRLRELA